MEKKRSRLELRDGIQATLEGYRRFDYDYIAFGKKWFMPDGDFRYRQSLGGRLISGFFRTILQIFAPLLLKVAYGCRVVGKENRRALRKQGAIVITNHIAYLDTLFVRAAVGHYRSFHTMAPWNNKKGVGGWFMRHAGLWAFSGNLAATKNLMREMERRLGQGKFVNFYAEQAMWVNYQKPRPMKDGAFFYAVKMDVPVLPVFCTFQKNKRGHMKKLRIHILPAVYADKSLPRQQRIAKMKAEAEAAWKRCYEEAYRIPLEYLPDRRGRNRAEIAAQEKQR